MRTLSHLLLLAGPLLLSACAGTGSSANGNGLTMEERLYDIERMQRYEGAARRGGARVYWVNKPRREGEVAGN